ncbi:MAG: hypothetical protein WC969_03170 [Elusimicrobiota bacterium]|jgi:hypothetical protein
MPATRTLFSVAFLLLFAGGAHARGKDADDAALSHGEELSSELRKAEKDSLQAALDRSVKDADSALLDARVLLEDARLELRAAARTCADADLREEVSTGAGVLAAKVEAFRLKAASAAFRWEALDAEALALRRGAYRPKDRVRDLEKTAAALAKLSVGRRPRAASAAEAEALDALRACAAELRAALEPLKAAAAAAPRSPLLERAERVEEDADGVSREADILSAARALMRIDEDSFEDKEER